MRILVSNDDGIGTEGLLLACEIARALGDEVWVVAPSQEQSGKGHGISLGREMTLTERAPREFTLSGKPADCVMVALRYLLVDTPPDLVLSGINHGRNLAEDIHYSGTLAGAREACLSGIKGIALSQSRDAPLDGAVDFTAAKAHGEAVVRALLARDWPRDCFFNVNFPSETATPCQMKLTQQGTRDGLPLLLDANQGADSTQIFYRFNRQFSNPDDNSDLQAISAGHISATPLTIDATHGSFGDTIGTIFPKGD